VTFERCDIDGFVPPYPYTWGVRTRMPERFGQRCRLIPTPPAPGRTRLPERFGQLCRLIPTPPAPGKPKDYPGGAKGSGVVEFEDGARVITSRRYLRKVGQ
jgi:hypothetical protein